MSENLRELVSGFVKIPADQINEKTVIDRTAVKNSIMLHRMYARLKEENFPVDDFWDIKTYGDLLIKVNPDSHITNQSSGEYISTFNNSAAHMEEGIGIDIEDISALPIVTDFRANAFYQQNFSQSEISYCILQQNPYNSFAGLFAAKEAIVKVDNSLRGLTFSTISIDHLVSGKPVFKNFMISISHTDNYAVAVAQLVQADSAVSEPALQHIESSTVPNTTNRHVVFGIIAILISVAALILAYFKQ